MPPIQIQIYICTTFFGIFCIWLSHVCLVLLLMLFLFWVYFLVFRCLLVLCHRVSFWYGYRVQRWCRRIFCMKSLRRWKEWVFIVWFSCVFVGPVRQCLTCSLALLSLNIIIQYRHYIIFRCIWNIPPKYWQYIVCTLQYFHQQNTPIKIISLHNLLLI